MKGKYKKIEIKMHRESDAYRLWKKRAEETVCYLESYKEKRSLQFHAENLLPSRTLMETEGKEYHLVLVGEEDGEVIHKDFGEIFAEQMGAVQFFQIFEGHDIEAYQFCIFCAVSSQGEMEIIYKGEVNPGEELLDWQTRCSSGERTEAFTPAWDETGCQWFRIDDCTTLPEPLKLCRKWVDKYQHYIIGKNKEQYFVGIPGRFLQGEQPLREDKVFLLWQPIRGGESFFSHPETMTEKEQEEIFGYWIAAVSSDGRSLRAF